MAGEPEKGDKVTWSYGGAQPSGEVAEKKPEGKVEVTSHRGNKISRTAKPGDPAVAISRSGNDVVKNASDLKVTGKKRGAEEKEKSDKKDEKKEDVKEKEPAAKKAKTEEKKEAPKKEKEAAPKKEEKQEEKKAAPKKEAKPKGKGKVMKEEKPTRVSTRNKEKK